MEDIDQFQTEEDLEKIHAPNIIIDEAATARNKELAEMLLDGILDVKMQASAACMFENVPSFAPWDRIAEWHRPENLLYNLVDRPEFMHKIIEKITDASLAMLDQMEEKGLLSSGQGKVHCSGAYTNDLPNYSYKTENVKAKNIWTFGAAQIFTSVSPAMHQEFELEYANRWYSRFGLVSYGCCEPLHDKIDILRKIPNLRKISMSPWVDVEKGAERIGKDFVFTGKPNPVQVAGISWDPDAARRDLRNTLEICNRYGCTTQFILKDISTVHMQPQRLWEWIDIAMELVQQ